MYTRHILSLLTRSSTFYVKMRNRIRCKYSALGTTNVLINKNYRKCVAFLVVKEDGEMRPKGTTFFVSVMTGNNINERVDIYAITARHVLDFARQYGTLFIRVNTRDGDYEDIATDPDKWKESDNTDVALIHVELTDAKHDYSSLSMGELATDEFIREGEDPPIGEGDDVFFVGLFKKYAGGNRNQPIVRFGNISLLIA